MDVDSTGRMSAPGFTVSAQPTSQTFITLVTTTSSSTTQFLISMAFQTVTVSATASPDSQDNNTDRAWIAGAVLGPVVFLLILLTAGFFIWRRRRQAAFRASALTTRSIPVERKSQSPSPPRHPSELHEDTIIPQPQELYGSPPEASYIAEKRAHQVPAQELPANEVAPAFQEDDTSKEISRTAWQSPDEIRAR
ncbi:unnamed protein product [Clonostachys byssicola]|uniref:Uncharacterized protein n=1 Tax=Clonostachys byssicola TaxID=160290 RepID=A0A9N9Y6H3_9HYPO|nr:unnamed protein product [Clonostachys byssicola]